MTHELNREETVPEETHSQTSTSAESMDVPSVEWLVPWEEDEDDENTKRIYRKKKGSSMRLKRGRGRPPLSRNFGTGLGRMDHKAALLRSKVAKTKKQTFTTTDENTLLSRTALPDHDLISSAEAPLAPQRPPLTQNSSTSANTEFKSPAKPTRVSPNNLDMYGAQGLTRAHPVKQGTSEPPHRLWLCPSQEPISPTKHTVPLGWHSRVKNPEGTSLKEDGFCLLRECNLCTCLFTVESSGDNTCHLCRAKQEPNHSTTDLILPKPSSRPKNSEKTDINGDDYDDAGDEDDEDDGDEDDYPSCFKKRNRRMCKQCEACLRDKDCGQCDFCIDKPKFGGSNRKRQKCRLRQCKLQSRLVRQKFNLSKAPTRKPITDFKRPEKPRARIDMWEDENDDDDDDEDWGESLSVKRILKKKGPIRKRSTRAKKNWTITFKEQDDQMYVEAEVDVDDIEEDSVSNGPKISSVTSNVSYSTRINAEVMAGGPQGADFTQIEVVRVGSPVTPVAEQPQDTGLCVAESQSNTPVITQIFSLAGAEPERDQGLTDLFSGLRRTVLPAHWVTVMAQGPVLQILQCSKLSTMADTVLLISKGFFYQVTVQNQALLPMHFIYGRHPTCLPSVEDVVSLLLDLEGLSVCRGYCGLQLAASGHLSTRVRSALCCLLLPVDVAQCEKCARPPRTL